MITRGEEDYLRTIYEIWIDVGEVHSVEVARRLGVSKPSVRKTLDVLERDGYVEPSHYGPVHLTEEGRAEGRRLHDRYVVIERFLTENLGVEKGLAAEEAHGIEHSISYDTGRRLEDYMRDRLRARDGARAGHEE